MNCLKYEQHPVPEGYYLSLIDEQHNRSYVSVVCAEEAIPEMQSQLLKYKHAYKITDVLLDSYLRHASALYYNAMYKAASEAVAIKLNVEAPSIDPSEDES